jgi:hypothetical protein
MNCSRKNGVPACEIDRVKGEREKKETQSTNKKE